MKIMMVTGAIHGGVVECTRELPRGIGLAIELRCN